LNTALICHPSDHHQLSPITPAFDGNNAAEPAISAGEVEKLHAKIGQLVVERDLYVGLSVKRHACHWQRSVPTALHPG